MKNRSCKGKTPLLGIFVGTFLQKRIANSFLSDPSNSYNSFFPIIISLDAFYQFGLNDYYNEIRLNSFFHKPWYDRQPIFKLISLIPFVWHIFKLSRRLQYFLFFVDTGILERTAIYLLNFFGKSTIVLQDAMKRRPRKGDMKSLAWFGGGNADLYLLTGERYISLVRNGKYKVVGSPIYNNYPVKMPLGKNILIVNQCFARYGELTENEEYRFMSQVVKTVKEYGPVELRLHPHNNFEKYKKLCSMEVDVTSEKSLLCSLKDAGIVIAINSTVILEALALGRPVLTIEWHPSPFVHLVESGIKKCGNLDEMLAELKAWQKDPSLCQPKMETVNQELQALVKYSGEKAKKRIIKEIAQFIHSEKK